MIYRSQAINFNHMKKNYSIEFPDDEHFVEIVTTSESVLLEPEYMQMMNAFSTVAILKFCGKKQ